MNMNIRESLDNGRTDACIAGWVELLRDRYESLLFTVENEMELSGDTSEFSPN